MSEWHTVADILEGKHTGATVRLRGWVHRQRSGGKIAFITLRDGSGTVQCTVKAGIADDESLDAAKAALIESSISMLEGEVHADERAPGGFEVKATKVMVHQRAEDFPLRGEQGIEFELDNRHLWLRSSQLSAILRIKSRLLHAIREFYAAEHFVEVDPSVITTNACEGGSTLFTFDYFGQEAFLSQSAQMYLEGCIFGNPKVYSITNSFRAEKSRTNKHLTEFHHLEAEYAWWNSDESMAFQERMVTYLAHDVAGYCEADLRSLEQDPERLRRIGSFVAGDGVEDADGQRFARITYHQAAEQLRAAGFEFPDGEDFGAPHEKFLTEGLTNPVFITDWPANIKAFYMHQDPENPSRVKCSDMLGPDGYGELIGGSQRSEDIEWMKQRLTEQHAHDIATGELPKDAVLNLAAYEWYFDLRRYGSVPHSGFGLGIERLLRWFTGQEHIRDMLPYPRTPNRAYP
jgi:asparaginyl-tRNA synthetase